MEAVVNGVVERGKYVEYRFMVLEWTWLSE